MTARWAAPGRVNMIGEHVDYQDGLVLPFALPYVTTATVSQRDGDEVTVSSRGETVQFPVHTHPGEVKGWAAYVAGVMWALREAGAEPPGLRIDIDSNVPVGAGLSSSAALECSVAAAVDDELSLGLGRHRLAAVARRAENGYVDVPTGVMDQLASMLSASGHALLLDCADLSTRLIPIQLAASGLALLVFDTHADHELVAGEYADRRAAAEGAAAALGVSSLRDATLEQVATIEDPAQRRRGKHVVSEIARVRAVVAMLEVGRPADIGGHLSASHESLRDDFEVSCEELDVTVDAALAAGALGSRMTGGGFGGCAIALVREADVEAVVARVQSAYRTHGWEPADVFRAEPSRGAHRVD